MKTRIVAVLLIGLLTGLASRSEAHQGDRVYPFYELTDADLAIIDLHDGSVEDWFVTIGEPSLELLDFIPNTLWDSYNPDSFDYRIWLGWHGATDRIYVAMERTDDVYVNQLDRASSNIFSQIMQFHDSSVNFWVDADHSGGYWAGDSPPNTPEELAERLSLLNQQTQMYMAIAEVFDDGPLVELWETSQYDRKGWFNLPPYADGGGGIFGEGPTISVTEFYVTPFDFFVWDAEEESAVSDLYPGKIIGFAVSLSDFEPEPGPGNRKAEHSMPGGGMADGMLLKKAEKIPEDTAVRGVTWARIKASFADHDGK